MTYKGKLPPAAIDRGEIQMKYGTTTGWQGLLGECKYIYSNPAEPTKFFIQEQSATGSYVTIEYDTSKNELRTTLDVGNVRGYVNQSESRQVDGHLDTNVESTYRLNVAGGYGTSYQQGYIVATDGTVASHNRINKVYVVAASESKSMYGSYGDNVNEHSGNWHESFQKDHVQAVTKNKITMVEQGDYAVHVQAGNWDTHIAQKARMYADNDILIESKTKITLKVGNSKIIIEPNHIQIISNNKAGLIDLN